MGRNDRSARISFIDHDSDSEMSTESVISDERRKTTRAVEKVSNIDRSVYILLFF